MKTYEVLEKALLEKALALIEDEKNWTGRGNAVDSGGRMCAAGACNVAEGLYGRDKELTCANWASPSVEALRLSLPSKWRGVPNFNDESTHGAVVDLFKRAIRNEKAKEGIPLDVDAPVAVPA